MFFMIEQLNLDRSQRVTQGVRQLIVLGGLTCVDDRMGLHAFLEYIKK